ncbi:MAG: hypothetical protein Athens071416_487 [Parcubacteria group bacterium Athens0714_16]|nr:MAG: hypothetical protein Athens071416_487 [Parcubacteria group bacterium Athens0714_16]
MEASIAYTIGILTFIGSAVLSYIGLEDCNWDFGWFLEKLDGFTK